MRLNGLLLLLLALTASAQTRGGAGARCRESCSRWVGELRIDSKICGRCLAQGNEDRGAWAASLDSPGTFVTDALLKDPDWMVRWGTLRAIAASKAIAPEKALANWIVDRGGALPCVTAVHTAASKKESLHTLLSRGGGMGPSSAAMCKRKEKELRKALEAELYAVDTVVRREALEHAAQVLELPVGRFVLDALSRHPPESDESIAQLLIDLADAGGKPAGKTLIDAAKPDDAPQMNRMLGILAKRLDAARAQLKAQGSAERRAAIYQVSLLGPLGQGDLEGCLDDPAVHLRLAAARGIAAGAGKPLVEYAESKLDPKEGLPLSRKLRWVEMIGNAEDPRCSAALERITSNKSLEEPVRLAALSALGPCAGPAAIPVLEQQAGSKSPQWRAAALEAWVQIPRAPGAAERIAKGLEDPDPQVLAAALHAAMAHRMTQALPRAEALLTHKDEKLRKEAVLAIGSLGTDRAASGLAARLGVEPSADVREAIVKTLGEVGGPPAMSALNAAAQKDSSEKVRFVAKESLRKLGGQRSTPGSE